MAHEGAPGSDRVLVSVSGGVAEVRLNRPEKMNAFDGAMFDAFLGAADALAADRSVRAVVLSGEGRSFCAGLDMMMLAELAGEQGAVVGASLAARRPGDPANRAQRAAWAWRELSVPVIAALHGHVLGAGLQIALGADVRFVGPDTRLSVLEIRWGIIPDMAGTYLLPRLVGPDVAKELIWTGRMVGAEEASRLGLATAVVDDPRAEALALASRLAANNPHAIRQAKRLVDASLGRGPAEQMGDEEATMAGLLGTPNQQEAVAAYFDGRDPNFIDP